MNWLAVLYAIPELIKIVKAIGMQIDMHPNETRQRNKEIKENLNKIAKAIEAGDEKELNNIFNSL